MIVTAFKFMVVRAKYGLVDLWNINSHANTNWCWKLFLNAHEYLRGVFMKFVGNCSSIRLMDDPWISRARLKCLPIWLIFLYLILLL